MYKIMQGDNIIYPSDKAKTELKAPVVTVENGTLVKSEEQSGSNASSAGKVSSASGAGTASSAASSVTSSAVKAAPTYEEVSSAAPDDDISKRKSEAKSDYEEHLLREPQYSDSYKGSIASLQKELGNRSFSYDPMTDDVYLRYRESVKNSAELALADATGLAAALNGGYGTSYAQLAGQTAYINRMKEADEMLPELYEAAYDRFNDETDNMEDRRDILRDLENDEWDRYMDLLENYNEEEERLYDRYSDLSDEEFDRFYSMYKLTL